MLEIYKSPKLANSLLCHRTGKVMQCLDFGYEWTNARSHEGTPKRFKFWNSEDKVLYVFDELVAAEVCETMT